MRTILTTCMLAALGVGGCARYTTPVAPPAERTEAERNFEALWDASREVLRKYYFTIDREDRRAGLITTYPMTGKHFFEFWRRDSVTVGEAVESSIQQIYHTATVRIRRTGDSTYDPLVEIVLSRPRTVGDNVISARQAFRSLDVSGKRFREDMEAARVPGPAEKAGDRLTGGERLARKMSDEIRALAVKKRAGR